jgi:hypothetical protein
MPSIPDNPATLLRPLPGRVSSCGLRGGMSISQPLNRAGSWRCRSGSPRGNAALPRSLTGRTLLTTRSLEIAIHVAGSDVLELTEMTPNEAHALLEKSLINKSQLSQADSVRAAQEAYISASDNSTGSCIHQREEASHHSILTTLQPHKRGYDQPTQHLLTGRDTVQQVTRRNGDNVDHILHSYLQG